MIIGLWILVMTHGNGNYDDSYHRDSVDFGGWLIDLMDTVLMVDAC